MQLTSSPLSVAQSFHSVRRAQASSQAFCRKVLFFFPLAIHSFEFCYPPLSQGWADSYLWLFGSCVSTPSCQPIFDNDGLWARLLAIEVNSCHSIVFFFSCLYCSSKTPPLPGDSVRLPRTPSPRALSPNTPSLFHLLYFLLFLKMGCLDAVLSQHSRDSLLSLLNTSN